MYEHQCALPKKGTDYLIDLFSACCTSEHSTKYYTTIQHSTHNAIERQDMNAGMKTKKFSHLKLLFTFWNHSFLSIKKTFYIFIFCIFQVRHFELKFCRNLCYLNIFMLLNMETRNCIWNNLKYL